MASPSITDIIESLNVYRDSLNVYKDSLKRADSEIDSLQQVITRNHEELSKLGNNVLSDGQTGNLMCNTFFWLIIICIIAAVVWWLYKKHKNSMLIKKELEVNYDDDKSSFSALTTVENSKILNVSPCIAAVTSDTRKVKNQDSCFEAYVEKAKARIIAIADGVGSSYKSEEGSKFVASKAVELVRNAVEKDEYHIDFDSIFDEIQTGLNSKVETEFAEELASLKPNSFGTTLIVGVDFPDRFVAAYVGNGSI